MREKAKFQGEGIKMLELAIDSVLIYTLCISSIVMHLYVLSLNVVWQRVLLFGYAITFWIYICAKYIVVGL